jgi:hypothetical protein
MTFNAIPQAAGVPMSAVVVPGNATPVALAGGPSTTDSQGNNLAPAAFSRQVATVYSAASTAYTGSGNSADLVVGWYDELAVDVNITVITGTSPTLTLFVDRKGADGIYYQVWASAQITTSTQAVSTSIGPGCVQAHSFGATVRLRWAIGGTSPSYTMSQSIQGK